MASIIGGSLVGTSWKCIPNLSAESLSEAKRRKTVLDDFSGAGDEIYDTSEMGCSEITFSKRENNKFWKQHRKHVLSIKTRED